MKTKLLFIIALLQFPLLGFSQKTEPIKCSVNFPLLKNDSVYIKGMRGKKAISKKFFKRKFELAVSNKSYKIVGFYINWNDLQAKIYKRGNRGARVSPEIGIFENDKKKYSLRNLEPGVVIGFDCIILKKGNEYFKSLPVVYHVDL